MFKKFLRIILVIFVVSGSIIFHEAAHFAAAKLVNIPVKQASLGFGPSLGKITQDQIEYHIRALPLGGFVELDTDAFSAQHDKAIFISLVGPFSNFLIFLITCYYLLSRFNKKGLFFKIENNYFYQNSQGDTLSLTPGVEPLASSQRLNLSVIDKIKFSLKYMSILIGLPVKFNFLNILHQDPRVIGKTNKSSLVGPIGIFKEIYFHTSLGLEHTLLSILSLNLSLGFFNLLPFPFLDGGKVFLHLIMIISGASLNVALGLVMLGLILISLIMAIFFIFIKIANKYLK